jgi:hypothetical protein
VVVGLSAVVLHPSAEGSIEPGLVLAEARLGNMSMIGHLRERANQASPEHSLLVERVLYSATHSGDTLDPDLFSAIRDEVSVLEGDGDPDVQRFCAGMRELLDIATEQHVPILFV